MSFEQEPVAPDKIFQPDLSNLENAGRLIDVLATGGIIRRRWRIEAELREQRAMRNNETAPTVQEEGE